MGREAKGRVAGPVAKADSRYALRRPMGRGLSRPRFAILPLVVFGLFSFAARLAGQDLAAPTPVTVAVSPTGEAKVSAGSPSLAEGEKLFRENRPAEAVPRLEQAVREPGVDEKAWLWLAVSYQQLGRYDEAIATLRKGLATSPAHKDSFYFNLGNFYLIQGKASFAKEMYDSAIGQNPAMSAAFLNRANADMLLKDFSSARDDYGNYLALEPNSAQRDSIQALLDLLGKSISADETKKAEAAAAQAAADSARKSLLDEVSASLKAAAEETTNLTAGSGQVQSYGDELPASD